MDDILAIMTLLLAAVVGIFFLVFLFGLIVEPAFMLVFNRPVYVHFYPVKRRLGDTHRAVLKRDFAFYRKLSDKRKRYFEHRVHVFLKTYKFIGRDALEVTEEMKVQVAATAIMLTFGMRKYITNLFSVIVLYPDVFLSANGEDYHKGEFNPLARAVVFSWKHFKQGLDYDNDNLNLGLHEFAHAVHFDSVRRRRPGSSGVIYSDMFDKAMDYVARPENRERLATAGYFRDYAYTNKYEFIAVLLEHFFETPREFRQKFPDLYRIVQRMINFREG